MQPRHEASDSLLGPSKTTLFHSRTPSPDTQNPLTLLSFPMVLPTFLHTTGFIYICLIWFSLSLSPHSHMTMQTFREHMALSLWLLLYLSALDSVLGVVCSHDSAEWVSDPYHIVVWSICPPPTHTCVYTHAHTHPTCTQQALNWEPLEVGSV